MQQLELRDGIIYLDGKKVSCVKSFNIASSTEKDGTAELTVCMSVRIKNRDEIELKQ